MTHTGVLAQNVHGAAQCFVTYCCEGARRLGGHVYPDITVDYIGLGHTLAAAQRDPYRAREIIARSVSQLCRAGAGFFVCADNTAHLALDLPGADLEIPGLHLAQLVTEQASTRGFRRLGLLGTGMTIGSDLYPRWCAAHGIEMVRPAPEDVNAMDRIVIGELINGGLSAQSRQRAQAMVQRFADQGCDAVVLASTELPRLVVDLELALPLLDTADIAARAALDVALGDRSLPTWRGGPHPDLPLLAA